MQFRHWKENQIQKEETKKIEKLNLLVEEAKEEKYIYLIRSMVILSAPLADETRDEKKKLNQTKNQSKQIAFTNAFLREDKKLMSSKLAWTRRKLFIFIPF